MEIILSRHGNTFGPLQPAVWAGSTYDPPLVEKGIAQAEKLAEVLKAQKVPLAFVFCGPLQRTRHYASIIVDRLQLPFQPNVDPRLNEIDYGEWTGLTNEQVAAKFGSSFLKGWDEASQWPTAGGWRGSERAVVEEVQSFVSDLVRQFKSDSRILVITSNGRLRYFLKLVEGEFERRVRERSFKVRTGHVCKLICGDTQSIAYWDKEPNLSFNL